MTSIGDADELDLSEPDYRGAEVPRGVTSRPRGLRKQIILREAARLFAERGFLGTGIDEIGSAAGITGPAVYRHFANKDQILMAIIDESIMRVRAALDELGDQEPKAALEQLVSTQIALSIEYGDLMVVVTRDLQHLPAEDQRRVVRENKRIREDWVDILLAARSDLDEVEARTMIQGVLYLIQGLVTASSGMSSEGLTSLSQRVVLGALLS